jgi:sugar O-acyltransferase (sialic acid O-acetyltransferase NeuD family)
VRLLILGAGGQGQVIADAVQFAQDEGQNIEVSGFLDDNSEIQNKEYLGAPVLGLFKDWSKIPHDALILGIGSNSKRHEIYEKLLIDGANIVSIIHTRALIAHDALIKPGCYIGAYVIIAAGTTVGCNSIIHGNSVIGHHNVIGDHVHIAPGVNTAGGVKIGNGSMIGISATIMPQRSVGDWAVVGSATLVNRNVDSYKTVVGVPGRILEEKNNNRL